MQIKQIQYEDQTTNKISIFPVEKYSDKTFLCLPALGVRASYYEPLAKAVNEQGFNVVTADWRGLGESSIRPSRKVDFGYTELISDLKLLAEKTKEWFPNTEVILLGHSLGGQLGSLLAARYPALIDRLILVASCSVHHTGWGSGLEGMKIKMVGRFFPLLSSIIGYFPGKKVGFGGTEARTLMKDWSANALNGQYQLINSNYDYELALSQMKKEVLALNIENDWLAPPAATKNLYNKFGTTTITHHIITREQTDSHQLNHFNWAKHPQKIIEAITKCIEVESRAD